MSTQGEENLNVSWVKGVGAIGCDLQLEVNVAFGSAGVKRGSFQFFSHAITVGVGDPQEVNLDIVPVLNENVNEFGVVGRIDIGWGLYGDFNHVFATGWSPGDVATAAIELEGGFTASKEGACSQRVNATVVKTNGDVVTHDVGVFPDQIIAGCIFSNPAHSTARVGEVNGDRVRQLVDVRITVVLDERRERGLFAHLQGVAATLVVARGFFRCCNGNHRCVRSRACAGFFDYHLFFKLVKVNASEQTRQHQHPEDYRCHILHVYTPEGSVCLTTPCVVFILWAG